MDRTFSNFQILKSKIVVAEVFAGKRAFETQWDTPYELDVQHEIVMKRHLQVVKSNGQSIMDNFQQETLLWWGIRVGNEMDVWAVERIGFQYSW